MKKRFDIKVLGQEFSIVGDSGDDRQLENVVAYVNGKVEEVAKTAKSATTLNIAILVALNIADEFLRFKGEKENFLSQLENKSSVLLSYIEEKM